MKKRRLISTALALLMMICSFGGVNVFAAEGTILYYEDFEGQTVDSAPTGIYKDDKNTQYKYSDTSKSIMDTSVAVVKSDTEHGKYLELIPVNTVEDKELSSMRGKIFLSEAVDKNDGIIVIEYDGLINIQSSDGNDGRKYIYATITGQNKDRETIYKTSEILKHKGSDVGNANAFMEAVYIADGTSANRWNGTVDGRKRDDGTFIRTDARMLYYYDDPIKNKESNEGNAIKRTNNTWQHYKLEINLATGEQQLWIDGKASEIWTDKEIYASVRWEGYSIDAISFQNFTKSSGDTNNTNWKIDNIKVYKPAPDVVTMRTNSYDGKSVDYVISAGTNNISGNITTMISDITLGFGSKMNTATVSAVLYDNTANAGEPVTLSWDETNRFAAVSANRKYLVAGHSYTLTVSGNDVSGNSFTQPTVINFTVGNDGGLAILSNEILSGGTEVNWEELTTGDTVTAKVTYVLTDETKAKNDIIIALVGEKNDKLCGFKQAIVDFDEAGCNTETVEFTVGGIVPDKLSAFAWSLDLRQVILDNVSISAE